MQTEPIYFKGERMYSHKTVQFNYTTYDIRRAQDTVNPGTSHCNVLLLSEEMSHTAEVLPTTTSNGKSHPFLYARVIGIFHANVIYTGLGMVDYTPKRMDFLWVRWYKYKGMDNSDRLDQLAFPPIDSKGAFGFVDPADVLRCCHIIPRFSLGKRHPSGTGFSKLARDSQDWLEYNVGRYAFLMTIFGSTLTCLLARFVDRDMLMRYHWGLGIGHKYSWEGSAAESCYNSVPGGSMGGDPCEGDNTISFGHDNGLETHAQISRGEASVEDNGLEMIGDVDIEDPEPLDGAEPGPEVFSSVQDGFEDRENEDLGSDSDYQLPEDDDSWDYDD